MRHALVGCAVFASVSLASAAAAAKVEATFTLSIHVAREDGAPAQTNAWIDAQIARAEMLFGPIGVHFQREDGAPVPDRLAHVETRADRDELGQAIDRGRISVYLVSSLRDVDTPALHRQGVHWRPVSRPSRHFVILAAYAGSTTLAHELGHFFGNGHTSTPQNVMSYLRVGDAVFFDEKQQRTIASFAGIYLRSKELVPVAKAD
ncbi:MAG TPA: hypothetical protein VGM56_14685 [Byssovorax sp.]